MKEAINRLGFEAWADNLIADALENFQALDASEMTAEGCTTEGNDVTVLVRLHEGQIIATVRAYVPGDGWKYHDRTIKLKPAAKTGFSPFDPVGETMKRFNGGRDA